MAILFRFHRDSDFIKSMSGFNPTINWRFKNRLTLWYKNMPYGIDYKRIIYSQKDRSFFYFPKLS